MIAHLRIYRCTINQMKYRYTKQTITGALACVGLAHAVSAEQEIKTEDLGTTTAVARRAEQPLSDTTSSLTSISADALSNKGITNLVDGITSQPGVIINRTFGQPGTGRGVHIRGLRPQDTQLRVDGIRFVERLGNARSLIGQTSLFGIERIELLKGGQAALYGAGANGGVLSLDTKHSVGDSISNRASIELGSFNSLSALYEKSGSIGMLDYYFYNSFTSTDNDTYANNSEVAGFDNDYTNHSRGFRLGYTVNEDLTLGLTFRRSESEVDTPQFGGSRSEQAFILSTLYADYQINDNWKTKLTLSYLTENSTFLDPFSSRDTHYDQFGISWENVLDYSKNGSISFGAEYENNYFSDRFGAPNGRKDHYNAVYLNHAYKLKDLTLESGVRYEDYASFGNHTSWQGGAKYDIKRTGTTIKANVGTGFSTPTFTELFSPLAFGLQGNSNLTPETTFGWDIGVEQVINENHRASLTFFETDIEDAIRGNFTTTFYENLSGKTKASGIEASFSGDITSQLNYQASYTWLDRSQAGQPEHTANAELVFKATDKLTVGVGAQYLDQRSYGGANLKDAFIGRVFGNYQLTEHVKLTGRIENFTDTEYNHANFGGTTFPARRLGAHFGVAIEW